MRQKTKPSLASWLGLAIVAALFAGFFFFPLSYVFRKAFIIQGHWSLAYFSALRADRFMLEGLLNSLRIAVWVTASATLLGTLCALAMQRVRFPGRGVFSAMMLWPMMLPPFVGAIGMNVVFSRFGAFNQLLMRLGMVSPATPPDWLGNPFWGIVILQTLHLFPIVYLNAVGALSLVDPALEEAARGLGASGVRLLRSVTMPLILPGLFAGAAIVFIWAFTDLGTPLIFNYNRIATVQIFDMVKSPDANPRGYALVVTVLAVTALIFLAARVLAGRTRYEMPAFGRTTGTMQRLRGARAWALSAAFGCLLCAALIPHISVILLSLSRGWSMTVLPEHWTAGAYVRLFHHPLASISIQNSLIFSGMAVIFVLCLGGGMAYILARKRFAAAAALDACAMLPLAVPGIVLAYGYVTSFSGTALDPFRNPVILLIISYAIRRLPLVVRAIYAGLQQTSLTLEEAGAGLGASPFVVFRTVTLPLIRPHIVGAAVLAFVFSMLEVSDSLILAMQEDFYPMTKAIYVLIARLGDGTVMAAAMSVIGIALLGGGMALAQKLLGRSLGQMFRT